MLAALAFPSTPVFCLTKSQLQGTSWYRIIPVCHVAVVVELILIWPMHSFSSSQLVGLDVHHSSCPCFNSAFNFQQEMGDNWDNSQEFEGVLLSWKLPAGGSACGSACVPQPHWAQFGWPPSAASSPFPTQQAVSCPQRWYIDHIIAASRTIAFCALAFATIEGEATTSHVLTSRLQFWVS